MSALRVDSELIDWVMMGLVVLHDLFRSQVKHANRLIAGARQNALVNGVEIGACDRSFEAVVTLNGLSLFDIPDYQFLILSTWADQSHVTVDLCTVEPVIMAQEGAFELQCVDVPHLNALIIAGCEECLSIAEKVKWFDRSSVPLNGLGLDIGAWKAQPHRVVSRPTGQDILIWRESEAWDPFSVSLEREIAFGVIDIP